MEERVLVVGAGTMGRGLAQVCAVAGMPVTLADIQPDVPGKARSGIGESLGRLAARGLLSEPAPIILARIEPVPWEPSNSGALPGYTAAIETVVEEASVKERVLGALERRCGDLALLASNTSGIRISALARALVRPERFLGLHFFNPATKMPVVEVIRGRQTADQTVSRAEAFVRGLGKEPVMVHKDIPGFVLNRIAMVASNEAIRLVEEGVATVEDIDRGVRGAFGWKLGPLETADLVGLDVVLAARSQLFEATGDPRFEPPVLLARMVAQGRLGRKTGRGFYDHED